MYNFSILVDDRMEEGFEAKIMLCSRFMINNMEIDDVIEGKNIVDLNGEQVENLRNLLITGHKKIVLINLNRTSTEPDYYGEVFRKAHMLSAENVKLSTAANGFGGKEFIEVAEKLCRIGRAYGIGVVFENGSGTLLDCNKSVELFYNDVKNPVTGLVFNPLEYVRVRSHPFFHEFYNSGLKQNICFLRINDGLFSDGSPVLPAEGNSEIKELASILISRGFKGYFSFTPYLENMSSDSFELLIKRFENILLTL